MDKGAVIPAEAVTAAFISATSEGGRFFQRNGKHQVDLLVD